MPPFRFYSLWSINAALDQTRLRRQLDKLKIAGLDGVVFHPRFYTNKPPYLGKKYLAEVSDAILHAKSIGLAFWIYDENGWPSGTVGGQLLKKYPNDAQQWAEIVTEKPERCLAEFEHAKKRWFLGERIGQGVDYFNPDLARHFLELTHERYRTGLKSEAWEYIEAVFCDEPEFGLGHAYDSLSKHGAIPWTPKLPELFRQRYGEDLLPQISKIFFGGENSDEIRIQFWELLTDIFNESFTAPINQWCKRHGKLFTAHVKGEEHPLFQVPTNGSCDQFFRNLSLPSIDALERFPGNNFYPRLVASAAQQFGDGRCMVEAFGGAGWGATPEDLERYLLWLGRHGLTDIVLHLSQYELNSAAIRDWPPSQPLHLSWCEVFPEVLKHVRNELKKNPPPRADTLMVAPYRGIMANYQPQDFLETNVHNAAPYPNSFTGKLNRRFLKQVERIYNAGMPYHIADERTIESRGVRDPKGLRIGNCVYKNVIMADGARLNKKSLQLLEQTGMLRARENPIQMRRKKTIQSPAVLESIALRWSLPSGCANALLLEPKHERNGRFACEFVCERNFFTERQIEIIFADAIVELTFNGDSVLLSKGKNGTVGHLPLKKIKTVNRLHFQCAENISLPFAWLHGEFRVISRAKFSAGQNGTIATAGPFVLAPLNGTVDGDLVQAGFPFLHSPLTAETIFKTTRVVNSIQLCKVKADAARITLNGSLGWTWGPRWEIDAPLNLGTHALKLELIPSTYNYFGPHHYFAGDHHVISPDQFTGKKNFADSADAPENTLVKNWHFRSLQLPQSISILS
ncbi:MAG: hypothetical protein ACREFE_15335 [Limisphaerales bacterium]